MSPLDPVQFYAENVRFLPPLTHCLQTNMKTETRERAFLDLDRHGLPLG
jgi:hypothetical protein